MEPEGDYLNGIATEFAQLIDKYCPTGQAEYPDRRGYAAHLYGLPLPRQGRPHRRFIFFKGGSGQERLISSSDTAQLHGGVEFVDPGKGNFSRSGYHKY